MNRVFRTGACRRAAFAVAVLALLTSSLVEGAAPTGAQAAPPALVLAGQSPWIAPGGDFEMRFTSTNVPADAQVAVTVHDRLGTRTAFDASITGSSLPTTRRRVSVPFSQLPVDAATNQRVLTLATTGMNADVYPIEVDLRSGGDESLSHFVTHIVVAPVDAAGALTRGQPLNVAWVWPLQTEPASLGSTLNPVAVDDLRPSGRLGRQATQLAGNTDVPLTLVPSPETLDSWNALAQKAAELQTGANAVRSATTRNQVVTGPYVPLDLPSVLRNGLGNAVNPASCTPVCELARGVSTLERFTGGRLDATTAAPGPLDADSLRMLQSAGTRTLVLPGDELVPVTETYTPAHPYTLQAVPGDPTGDVTVVPTYSGFEQFLSGDQPPALRAAHLLAGLAVVAIEQPSRARGIAVANPSDWDANDTFVSQVLAGLRGNPLLRPTTVSDLVSRVQPTTTNDAEGGPLVYRQLKPYSPPAPPVTAAEYARGVSDRYAVTSLPGTTAPLTDRADGALAASLASEWANPQGRVRARQLLRSIGGLVTSYLDQVEIQPPSTITITSSRAEIPISFRNTSTDAITVHLKLASDRLLFPDGAERDVLLPPQHNTTVRVAMETRGSGTAPVTMTVTTPGGLAVGQPTTIKVRSSFVSGVGLFIAIGAIVFLALWWGYEIHRRRKRKARAQHPTHRLAPPTGQPA